MKNRERYLNARSTIQTSLKHHVIPVINENDSVFTDELRFGDNDTLAARVAALARADALVMLTKRRAARYAAKSGCNTWIIDGRAEDSLLRFLRGEVLGTQLIATLRLSKRESSGSPDSYEATGS